jgi:Ser/Thr protein kinase RdoA (MazF antagonist)
MMVNVRVPKPSYMVSRLAPRQGPDGMSHRVLLDLAERYQLGEVRACHRVPRSPSRNLVLATSRGKYVLRRHHLSEVDVAYEHGVLSYLQQKGFPAPRMLTHQAGRAWTEIDGALYSVYEFVDGYCPSDFLWSPAVQRRIAARCGQMLAEYHRVVVDLVPSGFKWSGYRPTDGERWRDGDWFRQALAEIRPLLQKPTATSPMDEWAWYRIDAIHRMLGLEALVERHPDLSKLVVHGDYAPWNILFRPGKASLVLDFNESRLDLKIYDLMLATFWFAWRGDHLDSRRAQAFQVGYCQGGRLSTCDVDLAGPVFQWIMARSLTERLHKHYAGQGYYGDPTTMERQYQMCVFTELQSEQLVSDLKRAIAT